MSEENLSLYLKIWRQEDANSEGGFETYHLPKVSTHISFLEMLDILNEQLESEGKAPVAFEHDCREGICGSCGIMIDGAPHGGMKGTTTCQLHMRHFKDGQTIVIEPWRARAFPLIKDLVVDRSSFDRVVSAGAFISVRTGSAPEANDIPIKKQNADKAFLAAACIGCGACVASCKNASAALFCSAKVAQYALLPQGQPERESRVGNIIAAADREKFGHCTNEGECEAACPKEISVENIALMNREYVRSVFKSG